MKKLLLFVVGGLLVSCSDGMSDPYVPVSKPLIYPVAVPFVNASLPDRWEIEKEGVVLKSIKINDNRKEEFLYNGNNIIEIIHYTNSTLTGTSEFIYDSSGRLASITERNASDQITLTRVFNYSNPSLIEDVNTYYTGGVVTSSYSLFKSIVNGNLVTNNFGSIQSVSYQSDSYQYDSKQNVFSDLVSLDALVLYYSNDKVGKNNRTNNTFVFYYNGNVMNTTTHQYINTYDSNNRIVQSDFLVGGLHHYSNKFTY